MATGSGIKIQNLDTLTKITDGSINIVVDNGTTYKTSLNNVRNFFSQAAGTSQAEIKTLQEDISKIYKDIQTINNVSLPSKADNTTNNAAHNSLNNSITSLTETIVPEITANIDNISTNLNELSNTVESIENAIGGDIPDYSEQIETLTDRIDEVNDKVEKLENHSKATYEKAAAQYESGISQSMTFVPNEDGFNPLYTTSINDSYAWYDKYSFGNTVSAANFVISNDAIVSVDNGSAIRVPMPGTETFELKGVPLRVGMFNSSNAIELETKGDSYTKIYLNKSAFSSGTSQLSVIVNDDLVAKHKQTESTPEDDSSLVPVWCGFLESKSKISFKTDLTVDSSKANVLFGMVETILDKTEARKPEIEIFSVIGVENSDTLTVNFGINYGYNKQNIHLSAENLLIDGSTDPRHNFYHAHLSVAPRIDFANSFEETLQIQGLSVIQLIGYDDVWKEVISSNAYEYYAESEEEEEVEEENRENTGD